MALKYFTLPLTDHAISHVKTKTVRRQRGEFMLTGNFSDAVRPNYAIYCVLAFSICQDGFSVFVGDMTAARLSRVKEQVVYN